MTNTYMQLMIELEALKGKVQRLILDRFEEASVEDNNSGNRQGMALSRRFCRTVK